MVESRTDCAARMILAGLNASSMKFRRPGHCGQGCKGLFLSPTTILWALLMPRNEVCFVIRQNCARKPGFRASGDYCLFSTSSVGPVSSCSNAGDTYDRLLSRRCPVDRHHRKSLVGMFFGLRVCILPIIAGRAFFRMEFASIITRIRASAFLRAVFSAWHVVRVWVGADPCQAHPHHVVRFRALHQRHIHPPGPRNVLRTCRTLAAHLRPGFAQPRCGGHSLMRSRVYLARRVHFLQDRGQRPFLVA